MANFVASRPHCDAERGFVVVVVVVAVLSHSQ